MLWKGSEAVSKDSWHYFWLVSEIIQISNDCYYSNRVSYPLKKLYDIWNMSDFKNDLHWVGRIGAYMRDSCILLFFLVSWILGLVFFPFLIYIMSTEHAHIKLIYS